MTTKDFKPLVVNGERHAACQVGQHDAAHADSCKPGGPTRDDFLKDYVDGNSTRRVELGQYKIFLREESCTDEDGCKGGWKTVNRIQTVDVNYHGEVLERRFISGGRLFAAAAHPGKKTTDV